MSGDTAKRWIPTSVISSAGNHCLSTAAVSNIRLNGTREEDGVERSTTVGNVADPDTQPPIDIDLRDLDSDMISIRDKTGTDVSEKVRLYNQALLRYNDMSKMFASKPTPIVVVKEKKTPATKDIMAEVVTTLPKAQQEKGRQLVSRLMKTQLNNRGELLLHEGMVVPGRNVVDIVYYPLHKCISSDPIGWQ